MFINNINILVVEIAFEAIYLHIKICQNKDRFTNNRPCFINFGREKPTIMSDTYPSTLWLSTPLPRAFRGTILI